MKKNYFEPEMKISAFSLEDVITTSGPTSNGDYTEEQYNNITNRTSVSYQKFSNIIEFE